MGVTKKERDTKAHRRLTGKPWIKEASHLVLVAVLLRVFFPLSGISRADTLLSRFFCIRRFLLHSFAVSSGTNGIETAIL